MSKILIIFTAVLFLGCNSKAPACTNISWGDTSSVNEMKPVLMYSAGTNCSNYGDYYDGDLGSVIENIKKMKFVKSDECREYFNSDISDPEDFDIIECPGFLPEIIKMDKVVGCKFETPPDSKTDCAYGPLLLKFNSESEICAGSKWIFRNVNSLEFYKKSGNDEPLEVSFTTEEISLFGHFVNESDFWMVAFWTENDEEKKINALYTVEIID